MEIRCVKGMCGLKVARSEENLGFKGLKVELICTLIVCESMKCGSSVLLHFECGNVLKICVVSVMISMQETATRSTQSHTV